MLKIIALLIFAVFIQENKVFSQQPSMASGHMWNPYSCTAPFYRSTNNMWNDYYRRAHEVGRQFYKGWNSSGAANMFHNGVALAHHYARQIQKRTPNFAQSGAGYRVKPSQGNQNPLYPPQPYGL